MRNFILGALFGVGIGIAALLLLRAGSDSPEEGVPPREPAPAATEGRLSPSPTLASSSQGDEAILIRLAAVEAELRRVTEALTALTKTPASPSPAPASTQGGVKVTDSVETIRRAWSEVLDESEERLRPDAPRAGTTNPAYDSYMMDIRRARMALQEAQTIEDLRRLSEGEFKRVFRFSGRD